MNTNNTIILREYEVPYGFFKAKIGKTLKLEKIKNDKNLRELDEKDELEVAGMTRLIQLKSKEFIRVCRFTVNKEKYFSFKDKIFNLNQRNLFYAKRKVGFFKSTFSLLKAETGDVILDITYKNVDEVDDVLSYVIDDLR